MGKFYHGGKFHYILATVQRPEMLKFFSRLSPKRISLRTCLSRPPAWNPHFVYILKKLLNCLYILTKQRGNPLVLGIDWFPCDERRVKHESGLGARLDTVDSSMWNSEWNGTHIFAQCRRQIEPLVLIATDIYKQLGGAGILWYPLKKQTKEIFILPCVVVLHLFDGCRGIYPVLFHKYCATGI